MRFLIGLVFLGLLLPGCGFEEREANLKQREAALVQREQALLEKQNDLALKEKDLEKMQLRLQQQLDSTLRDSLQRDTTRYHSEILGQWNAVMTCTETTCPGSAVGDTKTETWVFSYEQSHLVAKAMAGDKVTRIYTGRNSSGPVMELTATVPPTESTPATKIVVRLNKTDDNTLDGQRQILREGGCSIMYSLKLTR